MPKIRCLKAPVMHRKSGTALWNKGDTAEVDLNGPSGGFWQGLIDQGVVEIAKGKPAAEKPAPDAPEVGKKYQLGKNVVTIASITDKAILCVKADGKKFPVQPAKWGGTLIAEE